MITGPHVCQFHVFGPVLDTAQGAVGPATAGSGSPSFHGAALRCLQHFAQNIMVNGLRTHEKWKHKKHKRTHIFRAATKWSEMVGWPAPVLDCGVDKDCHQPSPTPFCVLPSPPSCVHLKAVQLIRISVGPGGWHYFIAVSPVFLLAVITIYEAESYAKSSSLYDVCTVYLELYFYVQTRVGSR